METGKLHGSWAGPLSFGIKDRHFTSLILVSFVYFEDEIWRFEQYSVYETITGRGGKTINPKAIWKHVNFGKLSDLYIYLYIDMLYNLNEMLVTYFTLIWS